MCGLGVVFGTAAQWWFVVAAQGIVAGVFAAQYHQRPCLHLPMGSMLILFYLPEGVMHLFDADPVSRLCAALGLVLSVVFCSACLAFCRTHRV